MAWIGHELWHAWEVLRDESLTTNAAIHFFYRKVGRQHPPTLLETEAAVRAGFDVLTDLQNYWKATGNVCGSTVQKDV